MGKCNFGFDRLLNHCLSFVTFAEFVRTFKDPDDEEENVMQQIEKDLLTFQVRWLLFDVHFFFVFG